MANRKFTKPILVVLQVDSKHITKVTYRVYSLMLTYPCSPQRDFISQDGFNGSVLPSLEIKAKHIMEDVAIQGDSATWKDEGKKIPTVEFLRGSKSLNQKHFCKSFGMIFALARELPSFAGSSFPQGKGHISPPCSGRNDQCQAIACSLRRRVGEQQELHFQTQGNTCLWSVHCGVQLCHLSYYPKQITSKVPVTGYPDSGPAYAQHGCLFMQVCQKTLHISVSGCYIKRKSWRKDAPSRTGKGIYVKPAPQRQSINTSEFWSALPKVLTTRYLQHRYWYFYEGLAHRARAFIYSHSQGTSLPLPIVTDSSVHRIIELDSNRRIGRDFQISSSPTQLP